MTFDFKNFSFNNSDNKEEEGNKSLNEDEIRRMLNNGGLLEQESEESNKDEERDSSEEADVHTDQQEKKEGVKSDEVQAENESFEKSLNFEEIMSDSLSESYLSEEDKTEKEDDATLGEHSTNGVENGSDDTAELEEEVIDALSLQLDNEPEVQTDSEESDDYSHLLEQLESVEEDNNEEVLDLTVTEDIAKDIEETENSNSMIEDDQDFNMAEQHEHDQKESSHEQYEIEDAISESATEKEEVVNAVEREMETIEEEVASMEQEVEVDVQVEQPVVANFSLDESERITTIKELSIAKLNKEIERVLIDSYETLKNQMESHFQIKEIPEYSLQHLKQTKLGRALQALIDVVAVYNGKITGEAVDAVHVILPLLWKPVGHENYQIPESWYQTQLGFLCEYIKVGEAAHSFDPIDIKTAASILERSQEYVLEHYSEMGGIKLANGYVFSRRNVLDHKGDLPPEPPISALEKEYELETQKLHNFFKLKNGLALMNKQLQLAHSVLQSDMTVNGSMPTDSSDYVQGRIEEAHTIFDRVKEIEQQVQGLGVEFTITSTDQWDKVSELEGLQLVGKVEQSKISVEEDVETIDKTIESINKKMNELNLKIEYRKFNEGLSLD